jgi:hypothetical protein
VLRFLLLGPSGVGKTTVARQLEALDLIHIDIDQHHGFLANGLRKEWHQFSTEADGSALASALDARVAVADAAGIFVSLPRTRVLRGGQIDAARKAGIGIALLWGPPAHCEVARKRRDETQGLRFHAGRYRRSNADAFREYGSAAFDTARIDVFGPGGARRDAAEIAKAILDLLT